MADLPDPESATGIDSQLKEHLSSLSASKHMDFFFLTYPSGKAPVTLIYVKVLEQHMLPLT